MLKYLVNGDVMLSCSIFYYYVFLVVFVILMWLGMMLVSMLSCFWWVVFVRVCSLVLLLCDLLT